MVHNFEIAFRLRSSEQAKPDSTRYNRRTVAMKRHSSQLGIWFFAAMMLITGCNKKKQATVPPQAQAPTVSTAPSNTQPPQPTNPPFVNIPPPNTSRHTSPTYPLTQPHP